MIKFERYRLDNGLRIIVHEDKSTPLVSVCMTYNVGTKYEESGKTGFAHLFEHLMFGGSKNAPNFDDYIQQAGGENNAFTNQDMTVYYEYLPWQNLEVALWLEADRMLQLNLTEKNLAKERKVVVEEFKESCLNEPYGDIWHHIGPLAYTQHPYRVPTIGEVPAHIAEAKLEDVVAFFDNYYCPNNAVLSVAGNVKPEEVLALVQKWFGDIPQGRAAIPKILQEPQQNQKRVLEVTANVPLNALYLVFQGAERASSDYYIDDFITDVLADGDAARLYQRLVKEQELFVDIDAYVTASVDRGLLIIEGRLAEETTYEIAEAALWETLAEMKEELLAEKMVQKLQNKIEHNIEFSKMNHLHKAINLGYYELLGDANWINQEKKKYNQITREDIQQRCQSVFQESQCSVIYYKTRT